MYGHRKRTACGSNGCGRAAGTTPALLVQRGCCCSGWAACPSGGWRRSPHSRREQHARAPLPPPLPPPPPPPTPPTHTQHTAPTHRHPPARRVRHPTSPPPATLGRFFPPGWRRQHLHARRRRLCHVWPRDRGNQQAGGRRGGSSRRRRRRRRGGRGPAHRRHAAAARRRSRAGVGGGGVRPCMRPAAPCMSGGPWSMTEAV